MECSSARFIRVWLARCLYLLRCAPHHTGTAIQVWLQNSRSVALHLEVPYAVMRILDMAWGQTYYRGYQGYLPFFAVTSKILWSLPFSFGMFIINMQMLHWASIVLPLSRRHLLPPLTPAFNERPRDRLCSATRGLIGEHLVLTSRIASTAMFHHRRLKCATRGL